MKIIITEDQLKNFINNNPIRSKFENEMIRMVEVRGMFKNYENIIAPIVNYITYYVRTKKPDSAGNIKNKETEKIIQTQIYNFQIPDSLLEKIMWANKKIINVTVIDLKDKDNLTKNIFSLYKNANFNVNKYSYLNDNDKLDEIKIDIATFSVEKKPYPESLYSTLYHEITHAFEEYNRLKNGKNNIFISQINTNYKDISNFDTIEDQNIKYFYEVNYNLLVPMDINANIAGVYGDLERIKSIRKNFKKDVLKTDAYMLYHNIKNNIMPILQNLNEDYWEIFKTESYIQKKNTNENIPTETFKQNFIIYVNQKLISILRGIGKVASQYYDDTEIKIENNNKIKIENNNKIKQNAFRGWSIEI